VRPTLGFPVIILLQLAEVFSRKLRPENAHAENGLRGAYNNALNCLSERARIVRFIALPGFARTCITMRDCLLATFA
jgi:hypothetical protein